MRRFLLLTQLLGFDIGGDLRGIMRPLWRVHRNWKVLIPAEFRLPVPCEVVAAAFITAWSWGWERCAVLFFVAFHCLLRPEEARSLTWSDVVIFGPDRVARFRNAYGLVVVREPKTQRLAAHAAAQHVIIKDETLARFLGVCKSLLSSSNHEQRNWAGTPQAFSF